MDFGLQPMNEEIFKDRTKKLALRVIELVEDLPTGRTADVIGRQLLGSGTSVGANYRAACRGKSTADQQHRNQEIIAHQPTTRAPGARILDFGI